MTAAREATAPQVPSPADRYRRAERAMWIHHGADAPTEHWTDIADLGISVRRLEVGHGRPVLFIHGGPNAGATWGPLVGQLDGLRAIAVDRPGCGLSDALDYRAMTTAAMWAAMVTTLTAVLDDAGTGPVDVVASSFGGGCALHLALERPDLVRSLVLEGVPVVDGMVLAPNLRMLAFGPIGRLIARLPARDRDIRRTFRQLGHERLVDSGWPQGPDLDWGLAMMNDTQTMRNEVRLIQKGATVRGFRRGMGLDPERLPRITAPTLWLTGDRDPFGSPDLVRDWAGRMPASTVTVLDGSGHLPWLDDPARHARMIASFWQGTGG